MKTTYRIATILLIILGTAYSPQAITADNFSDNKKNAISKTNKISSFEGFYIHPNPIDNLLFTNHKDRVEESRSVVSVFTQSGKLVKQFTITGELGNDNLQFLAPGFYYLKVKSDQGDDYRKILKN